MKKIVLILLLTPLFAQARDAMFWNKETIKFKATDKIDGNVELGTRQDLTQKATYQNYARTTWLYQFYEDIKIGGGIAYFHNDSIMGQLDDKRIFQTISLDYNFDDWLVNLRYMMEERFLKQPESEHQLRDRFKLTIIPPIPALFGGHWIVSDEFFSVMWRSSKINTQQGYFQNRFFVGMFIPFLKSFGAEFGYMSLTLPHSATIPHNDVGVFNLEAHF